MGNDKLINQLIDIMRNTGAGIIEWSLVTEDDLKITIKIEDVYEEVSNGNA